MRKIKFRAWNTESGYMITSNTSVATIISRYIRDFPEKGLDGEGGDYPNGKVSPNDYILMQFTGLKDKNNVEIYDGDILSITAKYHSEFAPDKEYMKVSFEYKSPACGFILGDSNYDYIMPLGRIMKDTDDEWDVVVEGNIYENPELLTNK